MTLAKDENGFSIIEMLIAIAFLAVGMLAVGKMQLATVRNTTNANTTTQAVMLAHERMEELKNVDDITDLDTLAAEAPMDADGNPGGIYTRTTIVRVPTAPLDQFLREIEVQINWVTQHGGNRTISITSVTHGRGI